MKILYITLEDLSLHKGSVVHIREVIEGLQKRGHRVGLIGRAQTKLEIAYHFHNIHPRTSFLSKFLSPKKKAYVVSSILLFLALIRIVRKYDIIYARDFHAVIIAFLPRLMFGRKLVFEINGLANEEQKLKGHSFCNQILAFLIKKAEGMAVRCCNRVVSVTQQISDYLAKNFSCPSDKIRIVGNGVNIQRFHQIYDEALLSSWRKRLGITKDDLVVAFVGNLAPWQGMNILLESAFQILSNEMQNLKFLIVGEGIQKDSLVRKVFDSGHTEKFIFTGMVEYEDIPILINIADICVAPFISRRNQTTGVSPLKVFEYMACGKPVICSRIDGLEFVEVEGAGRLIDPEDVTSLEKALYDLIRNPREREIMGQTGPKVARERFSWESKVIKIEEVLEGLA